MLIDEPAMAIAWIRGSSWAAATVVDRAGVPAYDRAASQEQSFLAPLAAPESARGASIAARQARPGLVASGRKPRPARADNPVASLDLFLDPLRPVS